MQKLIHMHIPKCAGTSFLTVLKQWYPVHKVDSPGEADYKHQVISGHFPYNDEYWDHRWITFVRHPVDRLQSFYYYTTERGRRSKRNYWWNIISKMSLEDWLNSDLSKNHMTKTFAGKKPQEALSPGDFGIARKNASRFYFIGSQENFDHDLRTLAKMLNKPVNVIPKMLPSNNPGITSANLYGNDPDQQLYLEILSKSW